MELSRPGVLQLLTCYQYFICRTRRGEKYVFHITTQVVTEKAHCGTEVIFSQQKIFLDFFIKRCEGDLVPS